MIKNRSVKKEKQKCEKGKKSSNLISIPSSPMKWLETLGTTIEGPFQELSNKWATCGRFMFHLVINKCARVINKGIWNRVSLFCSARVYLECVSNKDVMKVTSRIPHFVMECSFHTDARNTERKVHGVIVEVSHIPDMFYQSI